MHNLEDAFNCNLKKKKKNTGIFEKVSKNNKREYNDVGKLTLFIF